MNEMGDKNTPVIIVSGLPRSGTSMMMRMLEAGGLPLLTDANRPPDADNPEGYCEYAPAKRPDSYPSWMHLAQGKAVKIVSALLENLPPNFTYNIIFMRRPMTEIMDSQRQMLLHKGESPGGSAEETALEKAQDAHIERMDAWLKAQPNIAVLFLPYHRCIATPEIAAKEIATFLRREMDLKAMSARVSPALYRQRTGIFSCGQL